MSQQTNIFSSFGPASTSQPTRAIGGAAARSLSELPLPPTMQLKLSAAGFEVVADFDGVPPAELATDLGIELREAQKLLAQVRSSLEVGSRDLVTKSALQMLHEEREKVHKSMAATEAAHPHFMAYIRRISEREGAKAILPPPRPKKS